jgi:hypothetical protein
MSFDEFAYRLSHDRRSQLLYLLLLIFGAARIAWKFVLRPRLSGAATLIRTASLVAWDSVAQSRRGRRVGREISATKSDQADTDAP